MKAGSGAEPSANRITLLRDAHGDGTAAERHVFLAGLNSPIGMTLIGDTFYVADTDAVLSFPYHAPTASNASLAVAYGGGGGGFSP